MPEELGMAENWLSAGCSQKLNSALITEESKKKISVNLPWELSCISDPQPEPVMGKESNLYQQNKS